MKNLNTMMQFSKILLALVLVTVSAVSQAKKETITFIHTDHLGSPIMATNEDGSVKWREDYQPFGKQLTNQDTDNNVGFTGHKDDKSLGLTYMQARWYHPEAGRFMSVDPIRYRDVHSFNRYVYGNNNPYKYVDPDGRETRLMVEARHLDMDVAKGKMTREERLDISKAQLEGMVSGLPGGAVSSKFAKPIANFVSKVSSKVTKIRGGNRVLDKALSTYNKNDMHHLFGRGGDAPTKLIEKFGSPEAALSNLQRSVQKIASKNYKTGSWVTVKVGDMPVSVKGAVKDGVFRISSIAKKEF